jgi:hypothetical protein
MKFFEFLIVGLSIQLAIPAQFISSSASENWSFNATSGRPVLDLVNVLAERFGWVYTYEEAAYEASRLRADGPNGAFVPVSRHVQFTVLTDRLKKAAEPGNSERAAVLNDFLAQNLRQGGSPLRAEITGNVIHIMPSIKAPNPGSSLPGERELYRSPMDVTVTLQSADAYPNIGAAIQDIVAQVQTATKTNVVLADMPYNIVLNKRLLFDIAPGLTARATMADVLSQIHGLSTPESRSNQLSWALLYDGGSKAFFLSVFVVPNSAPSTFLREPGAAPNAPTPPDTGGFAIPSR